MKITDFEDRSQLLAYLKEELDEDTFKYLLETETTATISNELVTTVGMYHDLSYKVNGVRAEHLLTHCVYNMIMRFGRGLWINKYCVYLGYFKPNSKHLADAHELVLKVPPKTKCNAPYH